MKQILILIALSLLLTSCEDRRRTVELQGGKIQSVYFKGYAHLFEIGDSIVTYTGSSSIIPSFHGRYTGVLPEDMFDYYVDGRQDTVYYHRIYQVGVILD